MDIVLIMFGALSYNALLLIFSLIGLLRAALHKSYLEYVTTGLCFTVIALIGYFISIGGDINAPTFGVHIVYGVVGIVVYALFMIICGKLYPHSLFVDKKYQ